MAVGKGKAATTLVKMSVKYGPVAYAAVKNGREPAQAAAKKLLSQRSARQQALAHAQTLLDGSAYKAFAGDQQIWVVFSGDEPVATHPATDVPMGDLLAHADLGKRLRPEDVGRRARRARATRLSVLPARAEDVTEQPAPTLASVEDD